jgi:hypothetical protein
MGDSPSSLAVGIDVETEIGAEGAAGATSRACIKWSRDGSATDSISWFALW